MIQFPNLLFNLQTLFLYLYYYTLRAKMYDVVLSPAALPRKKKPKINSSHLLFIARNKPNTL